ncbi:MAG: family N-acetyltransferase [Gemmatimonadetes bacterium]|jgi:hypothetical protein|nr:family N-acetyltransferase [Gemmatimonadota bacterium]
MTSSTRLPISLDRSPRPGDVAKVRAGLMAFNEAAVGRAVVQPLALYLRDGDGTIRGGLVGYLAWQWLYVATSCGWTRCCSARAMARRG